VDDQTLKALIDRVPIIKEDIMMEAANQPSLFIDAARYRVARMQDLSKATAELDFHRSYTMKKLRIVRRGKKTTEGAFREMVETRVDTLQLIDKVDECHSADELSKLLIETLRQRSKAIQIIAEAEFYEGRSLSAEVDKIAQKRAVLERMRDRQRKHEMEGEDDE
jgi:hypothetical protein